MAVRQCRKVWQEQGRSVKTRQGKTVRQDRKTAKRCKVRREGETKSKQDSKVRYGKIRVGQGRSVKTRQGKTVRQDRKTAERCKVRHRRRDKVKARQ